MIKSFSYIVIIIVTLGCFPKEENINFLTMEQYFIKKSPIDLDSLIMFGLLDYDELEVMDTVFIKCSTDLPDSTVVYIELTREMPSSDNRLINSRGIVDNGQFLLKFPCYYNMYECIFWVSTYMQELADLNELSKTINKGVKQHNCHQDSSYNYFSDENKTLTLHFLLFLDIYGKIKDKDYKEWMDGSLIEIENMNCSFSDEF